MPAAAICAGAMTAAAAPVLMTGVALVADQKLELPSFLAIKLPGIGEVKIPEMPKMPKIELPKVGGGGKAAPKETIYIDDNPNARSAQVKAKPQIKVGGGGKMVGAVPDAPTLDELKTKAGRVTTGGSGPIVQAPVGEYKRFPVRRMPGKNMSNFLDMARDL